MHYTYEDLVKKYGLFYTIQGTDIVEVFGFEKKENNRSWRTEYYENVIDAKKILIEVFKERYESSLNYLNNDIKAIEKESWYYKLINKKKIENYFNQKKADLKHSFEKDMNINVVYKDTGIYYSDMSHFLKDGDIIYVAVTDYNSVEPGVYKAIVSDVDYHNNNNKISLRAIYNINNSLNENNESNRFTFNHENGALVSGYAYHNLFEDETEAINYLQNDLNSKIKKLDTMFNDLEKKKFKR